MNTLETPPSATAHENVAPLFKPFLTIPRRILNTFYNWRELWFWPAFALLQWYLLIKLAAGISGRTPEESMDFLVGLGANVLICVIAISLVSILKEATGTWWTKDELKRNPIIACESALFRLGAFLALLWALKH